MTAGIKTTPPPYTHDIVNHDEILYDFVGVVTHLTWCFKAVDKWVLGGAEAPPNFWHLYLKDIAHSHSTQLLMMCSES